MSPARKDYAFHGYEELWNFIYCLLLKTRVTSKLPGIMEWEEYMDVKKLSRFPVAPLEEFLKNNELGKMLAAGKTSEFVTFCQRCREFIDRVVVLLLKTSTVTSMVSRGLYSFCPALMLEGDNTIAFTLFADLCGILADCGALLSDEAKAAHEEYTSFVVEQRRLHSSSDRSSESITDVMQLLLQDFSFQARHRLLRVFKLCCLTVGSPCSVYPSVAFDLSGSALSSKITF